VCGALGVVLAFYKGRGSTRERRQRAVTAGLLALKPLMAREGLRGGLNGGFKVGEGKSLTGITRHKTGAVGFRGSIGGGRERRQVGPYGSDMRERRHHGWNAETKRESIIW
jgi:hypothetical protein